MTTASIDLRLAVPAATGWLVAGVLIGVPGWAVTAGVVLWSSAGLATAVGVLVAVRGARTHSGGRRGHPRVSRIGRAGALVPLTAVSCTVAALVASVIAVNAPQRLPDPVRAAAEQHAEVLAVASIDSSPLPAAATGAAWAAFGERYRFRATLRTLTNAGTGTGTGTGIGGATDPARVAVPVVVFAELPGSQRPRIGTTVRLTGTLRLTEPGDDASALFFARDAPHVVAEPAGWLAFFGDLRAGFTAAASDLPGDGGDLLPGLAIGDTAAVSEALDSAMKTSSLSHLTAVSGANCAIVIAAIMLLGGYLRLRRAWRIALSLLALLGFVVLVTPEPSVLRSSVMATLTLLALGVGRPGRGVPTLALSVIVLIGLDPWLSRNYGFALSVLATGGLLLLSGPLAQVFARWMPAPLASVIALPVAAQLACQPVLVLLSPTLPLYGVPANLLAAPAAPIATVVGLLACLILPVLPPLGTALVYLGWLPASWIAAVAQTTATLPLTTLPWIGGLPGALGILFVTAAILALLLSPASNVPASNVPVISVTAGPPRTAQRARGLWRPVTLVVLIVGFGIYVGGLIGAGAGRALAFPTDWQIAACDVGQGDAVVVRNQDQTGVTRFALIDTGAEPTRLTTCLNTLGIDRISLLLLTHYDLDHIGGVEAVLGRVDLALVGEPENARDEALHTRLSNAGATVTQAARGDFGTLGDLRWDIYWPVRGSALMQVGNDGSVTIGFGGRGIRSLFLGDLGEESQRALLAVGALPEVDVVKVAHHGSGDQSADIYRELNARVGVISVGDDNGYGHPTDSLLDLLAAAKTAPLRTDRQGLVVIAPAPNGGLRLWTEHADRSASVTDPSAVGTRLQSSMPERAPVRLDLAHRRLETRGRSTRRTSRGEGRTENTGQDDHRPTRVASGAAGAHRARLGYRSLPGRPGHPAVAGLPEARRPEPGDQRRAG